jgi:hypothetical protein
MENQNLNPAPIMNSKSHPMELIWVFKLPLIGIGALLVMAFFGYYSKGLLLFVPITLIYNLIRRRKMNYQFSRTGAEISQGSATKKHLSFNYGELKTVQIKRDVFDSFFGIGQLMIETGNTSSQENAPSQTYTEEKTGFWNFMTKQRGIKSDKMLPGDQSISGDLVVSKNKVVIPGLKISNAEEIKDIIDAIKDKSTTGVEVQPASLSGLDIKTEKTKGFDFANFSWFSLALFFVAIAISFINFFAASLIALAGLFFGIAGCKTSRKGFGITGTVLNSILLVIFFLMFVFLIFLFISKVNPETGEPMTQEEMQEWGIE